MMTIWLVSLLFYSKSHGCFSISLNWVFRRFIVGLLQAYNRLNFMIMGVIGEKFKLGLNCGYQKCLLWLQSRLSLARPPRRFHCLCKAAPDHASDVPDNSQCWARSFCC